MRADRLLSMLMLLQTRGRMTAEALAETLEVSERTIYRDVEALSIAGVPVYTERGPGGGISLIDSYRTSLTGLNENEIRALFMLSIPAPLAQLGVSEELKAALLKLSAALPATQRHAEARVRQRIYLDWEGWFQETDSVPHLPTLQQAVWEDRRLHLWYHLRFRDDIGERRVDPYGLVAKAGMWYLVCAKENVMRVYRVSRVADARLLPEHFERPPDFDLARFWKQSCEDFERSRPTYLVTARVSPVLFSRLPHIFGKRIRDIMAHSPPDEDGWHTLELPFETLEDARTRLLGLGRAVEVLAPLALRMSIQDFAEQTLSLYRQI